MIVRRTFSGYRPILSTINRMTALAAQIARGEAEEEIWFLEHESGYTAGTSALPEVELIDKTVEPIPTGRGGKITWMGPGQRVVYPMLNLRRRALGPREYVYGLQKWVIDSVALLGVRCHTDPDHIGVWIGRDKVAAVGVRISRGVSLHGVAVNVDVDAAPYRAIVPCGIPHYQNGVTDLKTHLKDAPPTDLLFKRLDRALKKNLPALLGE